MYKCIWSDFQYHFCVQHHQPWHSLHTPHCHLNMKNLWLQPRDWGHPLSYHSTGAFFWDCVSYLVLLCSRQTPRFPLDLHTAWRWCWHSRKMPEHQFRNQQSRENRWDLTAGQMRLPLYHLMKLLSLLSSLVASYNAAVAFDFLSVHLWITWDSELPLAVSPRMI